MPTHNPLQLGELYLMVDAEDQQVIDELKQKMETALNYLNDLITALDTRVTTLEDV